MPDVRAPQQRMSFLPDGRGRRIAVPWQGGAAAPRLDRPVIVGHYENEALSLRRRVLATRFRIFVAALRARFGRGGRRHGVRERYLSRASDHADLERRVKAWNDREARRFSAGVRFMGLW